MCMIWKCKFFYMKAKEKDETQAGVFVEGSGDGVSIMQ
jgi:hypothetical protein